MKSKSHASMGMGGFSEQNERVLQHAEVADTVDSSSEEQLFVDYLIEMGFVWEEAIKLINMREHLYENAEMHQRMADDCRMHFARWLYEQGEIRET